MLDKFNKAVRFLFDKGYRWLVLGSFGKCKDVDDKEYLETVFDAAVGYPLNLDDPKTFNEKIQWLKLYNRNPQYTSLVDKYEVKQYISTVLGDSFLIPTIGVWNNFEDIDFERLPNRFVLKCTHDSHGLVICKDKVMFDKKIAKKKISHCLRKNFYWLGREWPYQNVIPRIIAEEYIEEKETKELRDYKFFVFNGKVKCFKIDYNRFTSHGSCYFDVEGNQLPFSEKLFNKELTTNLRIPDNLHKMIEIAEKLAADMPFVRVDLYNVDGQILFGEFTFYPASGFGSFTSNEWDVKLGNWLDLSNIQKTE